MPDEIFLEIQKQIIEAEKQAMLNNIKTNTVILNGEFAMCKEFFAIINKKTIHFPPMIFGKHFILGKLPNDYEFALTYVDEEKYESDLEYYKKQCEKLQRKLEEIEELLQKWVIKQDIAIMQC